MRPAQAAGRGARPRRDGALAPTRRCASPRCRRWPRWRRPARSPPWNSRSTTTTARCGWRRCARWAPGASGTRSSASSRSCSGKSERDLDLTEKMAFFEAYGAIAGPTAIPTLQSMLLTARACSATRRARRPARAPRWRWAGSARPRRGPCCRRWRTTRTWSVRHAVSRALRGQPRMSTGMPSQRQGEPPVAGRRAPHGRARAAARPVRGAAEPQALSARERHGAEGARRPAGHGASASSRTEGDVEIRLAGDFIFVNADPAPARARQLRLVQPDPGAVPRLRDRRRPGASRASSGASGRRSSACCSACSRGRAPRAVYEEVRSRLERAGVTPPRDRAGAAERGEPRGPGAARRRSPSAPTPRAWRSPRK